MRTAARAIALTGALALAAAAPSLAGPNPYAQPDDSWISLSGTVVDPEADSFRLDYGDGMVTVEMDDWDSYGDAYGLMDGDKVTVYGKVDDDLFETTTIEASSVYVEGLNTYFYASAADEEDVAPMHFWPVAGPVVVSAVALQGKVTHVDEAARQFTLDTNRQKLTVEVDELGYNPLDDDGYQKIRSGDRVSVLGTFDRDFLEGRVFEATSVVTLSDAAAEKTSG